MHKPILKFISTFPTATILYLALVLLTGLRFEWLWLVVAIIIDLLDDIVANV